MSTHDWHTLAAFGVLSLALSLFNPKAAFYAIGTAAAVVLVKNSGFVSNALEGGGSAGTKSSNLPGSGPAPMR